MFNHLASPLDCAIRGSRRLIGASLVASLAILSLIAPAIAAASAENPRVVALLSARIQNDNDGLDPLSDEETHRITKVGELFKEKLSASGAYKFVDVPQPVRTKIESGQFIGQCSGCEVDYGKQIGVDTVAWIEVQKVSNLILNLNVYMADVETKKMSFIHSVDIRGNTDESWLRSMTYLINNYLLTTPPQTN